MQFRPNLESMEARLPLDGDTDTNVVDPTAAVEVDPGNFVNPSGPSGDADTFGAGDPPPTWLDDPAVTWTVGGYEAVNARDPYQ